MKRSFEKILIGIAFSSSLKRNILEATRLSKMFNAKLIGVHADEKTAHKEKTLQDILKTIPHSESIEIIFKKSNPVKVILEICKTKKIDLLILGALQRENIFNYYLGSIARKLTRKAPCSVLLLLKRSLMKNDYNHMVVNGLKNNKTSYLIEKAFCVANNLECKKITIVEEIAPKILAVKAEDDASLNRVLSKKESLAEAEQNRIQAILKNIPKNLSKNMHIKSQSIFGKTGYSIGHYARVVHADVLVMHVYERERVWGRIFMKDIEYILSDLPTNLLLIKS